MWAASFVLLRTIYSVGCHSRFAELDRNYLHTTSAQRHGTSPTFYSQTIELPFVNYGTPADGHGDGKREGDEKRGDRHVPQRLFGAAA
jgi:hypothetical protein